MARILCDGGVRQKNIDVVLRAHNEVWNQGNYDVIDEIYAEDYQCHFICGLEVAGHEGMREFVSGHRKAFPDCGQRKSWILSRMVIV